MPIEVATLIGALDAANPAHDDSLGQMDSHLRMIKAAVKGSFPNLTAPVTASAADINLTPTFPGRLAALEAASNHLTGNQTLPGGLEVVGTLNSSAIYQGGLRLIPYGLIVMWYGYPSLVPDGWALCNGANGTPDLRDRFIVGAGNNYVQRQTGGVTTQTLDTAASGYHDHTAEPSGTHNHTAHCDVMGYHEHGSVTFPHSLTLSEIPPHAHTFSIHTGPGQSPGSAGDWATGNGYQTLYTSVEGSGQGHTHQVLGDGQHGHNIFVDPGGDHTHIVNPAAAHVHTLSFDNRPLFMALCFMMKI